MWEKLRQICFSVETFQNKRNILVTSGTLVLLHNISKLSQILAGFIQSLLKSTLCLENESMLEANLGDWHCQFIIILSYFWYLLNTYENCKAAKQEQQIKCRVKQSQAWKPGWMAHCRPSKQFTGQIIYINGTENECPDSWQHAGSVGFLCSWFQRSFTFKVKVYFNKPQRLWII